MNVAETNAAQCTESADHWDKLAKEQDDWAEYERGRGIHDVAVFGHRATLYRKVARTLRLEAQTGERHCNCHERPASRCPYAGQGVRT